MKSKMILLFAAALLGAVAFGAETPEFGAGEMLKPARTFYVSQKGNDKNDGKTLETAWRTVKRGVTELCTGDTLLIDEGVYRVSAEINVKPDSVGYAAQCGKPGSPIRISAMPGKNVVFSGADYLPNPPQPVQGKVYEFKLKSKPFAGVVRENPSQIRLQQVFSKDAVMDYPGTFYVDEKLSMLVHYVAEEQDGVNVTMDRIGLRIHGSWILVENLTFLNYSEGLYTRMNTPYDKNAAEHITIRNCTFINNSHCGLVIDGASYSLITKNRCMHNGERGSILMMPRSHDNLYTGNWVGPSPYTERQRKPYGYNYSVNHYGSGDTAVRNYVIGNVFEDKYSFRWKQQSDDSYFEDNLLYGNYYVLSKMRKISILRNWFGGAIQHSGISWNAWEKDFEGTLVTFKDNVRDRKDFNPENKIVFEAEKLKMEEPVIKYPPVTFADIEVKYIEHDGAAIIWRTPECDGWGGIAYRAKGEKKAKAINCPRQGTRHEMQLSGLKPDTEYEYQLSFNGRRPQSGKSEWFSFRTAKEPREPMTLEVDPAKMTLNEAALAVMPGDTVLLLPGKHVGQFFPTRDGLPDKPITIKGRPGAVIDGQFFYAPLINLTKRKHYVLDGISFMRSEQKARAGLIIVTGAEDISISNCRADYNWLSGPMLLGIGCSKIRFVNNISNGGDYPVSLNGKDILISHNTIVNATMLSMHFWSTEGLVITDNIFYRPCIEDKRNTALLFDTMKGEIVCDRNVYWSPVKEHPVGGTFRDASSKVLKSSKTLKEWQEISGLDMNSLSIDPLFVDYQNGDFRLQEGSPAKGKGATLP